MTAPTVFISYSHDSPEHGEHVLAFADQLVRDGVSCILDQYETAPPEGWHRWMDGHIRDSDFVITICTEPYYRRVIGKEEPGKGLGVRWEGHLIYDHIYQAETKNTRFIPVLFASGKAEHIPTPLGAATHYRVDTREGYEDLYRRLTDQPLSERPSLGEVRPLPPKERKDFFKPVEITGLPEISLSRLPSTSPDLFGREQELAALDDAWTNPKTNLISLVAWGGVGKTALVNKWLLQMGDDGYRGAQRVYGWSFYSQGAAEGRQASADLFIATALRDFGDPNPDEGSPWDKGERLADLVTRQRTLLVLDGLEPLQQPPGQGVQEGRLKDPGPHSLLRALARHNPGLCVVSTRLPVDDLKEFQGTTYQSIDLEDLSPEAGTQLLTSLGVEGTPAELKEAVEDFDGHALALSLLGRYLVTVYQGDVRQRDKIPRLTRERRQGGHARRVMDTYAAWFKGKPELSILHMVGLFDRPVEEAVIEALLSKRAIKGLTSKLKKLSQEDWQYSLANLRHAKLLADPNPNAPNDVDAHPLVREHFGEELQKSNPGGWKKAHGRLYEHYKAQAPDLPDTLDEMAPLFAAVTHGCHVGRHQETFDDAYVRRIVRGNEYFIWRMLGAFGADLAALSGFFDPPWRYPTAGLTEADRGRILSIAGFDLRALGRLAEAAQPLQAALEARITAKDWVNAARGAINLGELYTAIGSLGDSLRFAQQGVGLADRSGDAGHRMLTRTGTADVLHQVGHSQEAETLFRQAEAMQKEAQPQFPFLYSLRGFQYCDLLLGQGEYGQVQDRADQTLNWAESQGLLLDIALDHLSLGQAHLLEAQQEVGDFSQAAKHLYQAVDGLREAGRQDDLPRGLIARAALHRVRSDFQSAQRDLDEATSIAERGGMGLHRADAHLEHVRLHLAKGETGDARERLATARAMIEEMGYHRRDPEVAALEAKLQPR